MISPRPNFPCFRDDDWAAIREELGLSARELELVKHIFEGKKLLSAARAMGLSHGTVKTYIQRIHRKLCVADQRELVLSVFAAHQRAIEPVQSPDL